MDNSNVDILNKYKDMMTGSMLEKAEALISKAGDQKTKANTKDVKIVKNKPADVTRMSKGFNLNKVDLRKTALRQNKLKMRETCKTRISKNTK